MTVAQGTLTPLSDGIWVDTAPVSCLGLQLTATMSVIRIGGDCLLLYAPLSRTPARHAAITALGTVAHLYALNLFHHLFVGE